MSDRAARPPAAPGTPAPVCPGAAEAGNLLMREEFLGVVAHELKTPLAVIKAYLDVLVRRAEAAEDDAQSDLLRRVAEQTDHLLAIVEDLLDVERLRVGRVALTLSRFDLVALVREIAHGLQLTTSRHRIQLAGEPSLLVRADRERLRVVLRNLLENAIRYTPDGGAIEVSVTVERPAGAERALAHIGVRDHGVGIDPADLPHIFGQFYQGRMRRGQVREGLGVGLYLVREFVEAHRGRVWVEPARPSGVVFHVVLAVDGPEGAQ